MKSCGWSALLSHHELGKFHIMKYEIGGLKPPENMSLSLVVQSAPVWLTALHTADKTTYTKQAHANKWHICGNLVMAFWSVK